MTSEERLERLRLREADAWEAYLRAVIRRAPPRSCRDLYANARELMDRVQEARKALARPLSETRA